MRFFRKIPPIVLLVIAAVAYMMFTAVVEPAAAQKRSPDQVDAVRALEERAQQAAHSSALVTMQTNEIEMIAWRRHLMGQPGLQLYVIFFNQKGQPIDYFVTDGKCSSSNKRLIEPWKFVRGQTGVSSKGNYVEGDFFMKAASLDGTHGSSDPYIYCKTADGKYKQWNGEYYASNSPIELVIKPLVIDIVQEGESGTLPLN